MKPDTKISLIALAFASTALASPAAAQMNTRSIVQADEETRNNSTATIDQAGSGNKADGDLNGNESVTLFNGETVETAPNDAGIFQDGSGSTATIDQFGTNNASAINQADDVGGGADSSTATIIQGESGNDATGSIAYIDQAGDGSQVAIEQNGADNVSYGIQRGNLDGSQTGNKQSHTLDGDENRSEIFQDGLANEAGVTLTGGDQNTGLIAQTSDSDKASVSINGGNNRAEVRQSDSTEANNVDIDVEGDDNRARAIQSGPGGQHEATITQAGSALVADIEQSDSSEAGEGNLATVNQNGSDSETKIVQDGSGGGNNAQIAQEGETSSRLEASIDQGGDGGNNKADIDQTGMMQEAEIAQSGRGGGSVGAIDQSTDGSMGNSAAISQQIDAMSGTDNADIDQGGDGNSARVSQRRSSGGTGSNASITQPGNDNRGTIDQRGSNLLANISLNGENNVASIRQAGSGTSATASIATGSGADRNRATIRQTFGRNGRID